MPRLSTLAPIVMIGLFACGEDPVEAPPAAPVAPEAPAEVEDAAAAPDTEALIRGSQLYGEHCAACHGSIGEGDGPLGVGTEPAPSDLTVAPSGGAEARRAAIASGPGEHAFGEVLGEDLDAVVLFVGSLEGRGTPEDGPRLGAGGATGTRGAGGMRLGPGLGGKGLGPGLKPSGR